MYLFTLVPGGEWLNEPSRTEGGRFRASQAIPGPTINGWVCVKLAGHCIV
jgi:hypothetical protein